MNFFSFRRPLWFFQPGGTAPSSVQVCVSVLYQISASISPFDRDIELSAFAFNLSADLTTDDHDEGGEEVQAAVDLDDQNYAGVALQASITPVYTLSQSGQTDVSISAAYNLTASVTATIFPDNVLSLAYNLSASLSAAVLSADLVSLSVAYNMTASIEFALLVQSDPNFPNVNVAYGMSCSIEAVVNQLTGGGLVWSRKKEKYIPVGVGL